jgi:hypothetical protein
MNRIRIYPKKWLWRIYSAVLCLSLILGIILSFTSLLSYHFKFQYLLGFFALFGFFGCVIIILIAKGIGFFLVVGEDYYHRNQEES